MLPDFGPVAHVPDSVTPFDSRRTSAAAEGTVRARSLDDFLRKTHIPFVPLRHPAAFTAQHVAALSHVPGRSCAKTVACVADEELILAVVPAYLMVDLDALKALAKAAAVRLAREAEFAAVCPDYESGTISPLATAARVRVFVDRTLVGEPDMLFNAGSHTDAIRIHYWDFAELTQPAVGAIARRSC